MAEFKLYQATEEWIEAVRQRLNGILHMYPPSIRRRLLGTIVAAAEYLGPTSLYDLADACKAVHEVVAPPEPGNGTKKVPIPASLRWQVFKRDDFRCRRCGSRDDLHADHIIAESKGGQATVENLQTLCAPCNSRKGTGDA